MESQSSETAPAQTPSQKEQLKEEILRNLTRNQAHSPESATKGDWWRAVSLAVRGRMLEKATTQHRSHRQNNVRRVYYLSLEYLMGRLLENNLVSLGLFNDCKEVVAELGVDFDDMLDQGPDMGLGNGGPHFDVLPGWDRRFGGTNWHDRALRVSPRPGPVPKPRLDR